MKPDIIRQSDDEITLLMVPSHERGFFLVEEPRGMRIMLHVGQSALLGGIAPEDGEMIDNYDNDALRKYVSASPSEDGVFYSIRSGYDFSLRQNLDGTGIILGGHSNTLREFAPHPKKLNPLFYPMGTNHLDL